MAAPGDLDPTFGSGGVVQTDIGSASPDFGTAVIPQTDGDLVAGATSTDDRGLGVFGVLRYTAPGGLDPAFGAGGKAFVSFPDSATEQALAQQPDGKLVAAGFSFVSVGGPARETFALARVLSDGAIDTSFGMNGRVLTWFGHVGSAQGVAIAPDGKIVAAGGVNGNMAVARYNPDGSLDPTFSGNGKRVVSVSRSGDGANAVAVQPDGKIVLAGYATTVTGSDFALTRLNPNGSLDTGFGTKGVVLASFGGFDTAFDVFVYPVTGRILAVGTTNQGGVSSGALARFTANGAPDPHFGTGGLVTTTVPGGDALLGLAVQTDGKIVTAGDTGPGTSNEAFTVSRYTGAGTLDSGFGHHGLVRASIGIRSWAQDVGLQSDGKIVACGTDQVDTSGNDFDVVLVRYLST